MTVTKDQSPSNVIGPFISDGSHGKFVPHKNVPGPARRVMARADNSGTVNSDPMFIADRLAITNHVMAYSYLIDEGRWDDWFGLFADDLSFETTVPELGTVLINGMKAFREFIEHRYIIPEKASKGVRRHTQSNVHVAEQTATSAKVRTYMFISSVPAANELQVLTSGTYNASLEKRNGKWTITRCYIEVDVPLTPSKMPEGFSEKELTWIADPSIAIPGAGSRGVAIKGQVTLNNHPFAMGALYDNATEWFAHDIDIVLIDYLTESKSAAAVLPEQCTTVPIPELPGYSAVKQVWAKYRESSFGPYQELMPLVPCLFKGQLFLHVPYIYVDNDAAMAGGRELAGRPTKMADICMERVGDEYRCTLDRRGQRLASARMHVGAKVFSTPLPAHQPVPLPYPFNITMPLPAPSGMPQATVPLTITTIKLVPGVGTLPATPAIARLVAAPWLMKGAFFSGSGASLSCRPSEMDPIYKLPMLKTLGAMYFEGSMSLALKDMTVLDDMLKK